MGRVASEKLNTGTDGQTDKASISSNCINSADNTRRAGLYCLSVPQRRCLGDATKSGQLLLMPDLLLSAPSRPFNNTRRNVQRKLTWRALPETAFQIWPYAATLSTTNAVWFKLSRLCAQLGNLPCRSMEECSYSSMALGGEMWGESLRYSCVGPRASPGRS